MHVDFACPACETAQRASIAPDAAELCCLHCSWKKPLENSLTSNGEATECPVCSCTDLWKQKDFPPKIGLTLVGLGILLSTLAWADLRPVLAIGVLMGFALLDLVLYALMPDVLVCYRCDARLRDTTIEESHPRFDLEVHERYRQESMRVTSARS